MTLAQLGAEVVRIDPLGGAPDHSRWPLAPPGTSLYWAGLNKLVYRNLLAQHDLMAGLLRVAHKATGNNADLSGLPALRLQDGHSVGPYRKQTGLRPPPVSSWPDRCLVAGRTPRESPLGAQPGSRPGSRP